jgi:hypothetical protein
MNDIRVDKHGYENPWADSEGLYEAIDVRYPLDVERYDGLPQKHNCINDYETPRNYWDKA